MTTSFRNEVLNSRAAVDAQGISYAQNTTGAASRGTDAPLLYPTYAYHDFPAVGQDFADIVFDTAASMQPGQSTISAAAFVRQDAGNTGVAYLTVIYDYTLSDGTTGTDSRFASQIATPSSGAWTQLNGTFNPLDFFPSGNLVSVSNIRLGVRYQLLSGLPAFRLSASFALLVVNPSLSQTYDGNWFDGGITPTANYTPMWLGTPYYSTSLLTLNDTPALVPASAPTITPEPEPPAAGVAPRSYSPINLTDYSVIEDSTPTDPTDTTGGYGQFTVGIGELEDTRYLHGVPINLRISSQGETVGTVRGLGGDGHGATVTADSRLAQLNAVRTAQPVNGTLASVFTYYLSLVGINTGIVVDTSIGSTLVVYPGWSGNVWDQIRKMATALGAEVALVSNNVVLRPVRLRDAETYRNDAPNWNLDSSQMARSIEVYWYDPTPVTNSLVYPTGGWNPEVPILTVGAGETQTFDIPLSASLSSISQPVAQDFVDRYYTASSVYAVTGNDGLPYLAAQWLAEGGSVTATVNADTRSITVTVVGASGTQFAPYSIAVASGPSDRYSSLRLVGTGVAYTRNLLTLDSSVDPDVVSVEVGATVDSEFITSLDQAMHTGLWGLKRWGSPRYTISVTSGGINRVGDSGSYRYPTVAEFDAVYSGDLVSDFDAEWSGQQVEDFNAYMISLVSNEFANQAFGNVGGARVPFRDTIFRIRTATNGSRSITYSAEDDTTVGDFDSRWDGMTVADFDAEWLARPLSDFPMAALRRSA